MSAAGAFLQALQSELGGTIRFDRFMQEALYNPSFGYYTARINTVGRRGDFSTMATLDHSLAAGIAAWIQKQCQRDVIEIGGGTGQLARDILASLGWWKRRSIRYHIVEVSGPLREAQKKLLRAFQVRWHESLPAALEASGGSATLFSNELVDAFPCRVLERVDDDWQELHLRIEDREFRQILQPCTLPDSTVFQHPFRVGQRVEVHESYDRWLQSWAPRWKSGSLLTIDYGNTMPALYHRRPQGSLRGYAAHQLLSGAEIYQAPGRCDITADVNFSDLEAWGNDSGWTQISRSNLADFLAPGLSPRFQAAATAFQSLEQSAQCV